MASITNPYFVRDSKVEQTLFNSLKTESIQVMGRKYFYLPRHVQTEDLVLGEDVISKFTLAVPIEMYMQDVQGFQGDKEMFSKFGLQVNSSYTLIVAVDRWEKEIKRLFDNDLSNGEADFDVINNRRPQEGDLIYDPLTKFLMVITFCDHDTEFYQLGKNYLYHLTCEAYQYQAEQIQTGVSEIDAFENESLDVLRNQIFTEDGDSIVIEPWCDSYLLLDFIDTTTHYQQHGIDFDPYAISVDYRVNNPFGDNA